MARPDPQMRQRVRLLLGCRSWGAWPARLALLRQLGTGSGTFEVAEMMARVFPDFKAFARNVEEELGGPISFGPYPNDNLPYLGNREVVYKTPAQTEGLGTHFSLRKSGS